MRERQSIRGSDRTIAKLRELYRRVAVRPFDLRPELSFPLESISTQMQLYEWEYNHQTGDDCGWRTVKVTVPLTGWSLFDHVSAFYASPNAHRKRGSGPRGSSRICLACLPHALPIREVSGYR
jgi:hypothetical protein